MRPFMKIRSLLGLAAVTFSVSLANAQSSSLLDPNATDTMSALMCSDATQVMQNPLNYICIDSLFPIRISGSDMGQATDGIGSPHNAYSSATCTCNEIPSIPIGMWAPDRFIEVVEKPGCSPLTKLDISKALTVALNKVLPQGRDSTTAEGGGNSQAGFRHINIWQSNLPSQLSLPVAKCQPQVPFETSLILPFWNANDPVTPNLIFPEWNLFFESVIGFPQSTLSCINATLGIKALQPIEDAMYWQLGCWGKSLPANGRFSDNDPVRSTALLAARSLFYSNRTGGNGLFMSSGAAVCGPVPTPFPWKSNFKHSMVFPYTETQAMNSSQWGSFGISSPLSQIEQLNPLAMVFSACAHSLGSSHWRWGIGKNTTVSPRDYVYMQWRWIDCCQ